MKNLIVKIIKSNSFLYNLAKKFYRLLNKEPNVLPFVDDILYIGYELNDISELDSIKKNFENLNVSNSKIVLILKDYEIDVNDLMPDYIVISLNYFKKYHKKFRPNNLIMANSLKVFKDVL